ncbi:hypothetical protein D3C85_1487630 [compost metagenome]
MKALMLPIEPVSVRADAVPPTVTPPPLVALRLPAATLRVTVTLLLPASRSLKLMPVMAVATSSLTAILPGTVTIGASLVVPTVRVRLAVALKLLPSLTAKPMVRVAVAGVSELLP